MEYSQEVEEKYSQVAEKTDKIIKLITKWGESINEFCEKRNKKDILEFQEKGINIDFNKSINSREIKIYVFNNDNPIEIYFKYDIRKEKYITEDCTILERKKANSGLCSDLLSLYKLTEIRSWYFEKYKHSDFNRYFIRDDEEERNKKYQCLKKILEEDNSKSSLETLKDIIKSIKQTDNDNEIDTFFDAFAKTINNVNKYLNKKNKYLNGALRKFENRDLKAQIKRINSCKKILEVIEDCNKNGKTANMSDKEISAHIAKGLGIEDEAMYYAFIEYAEKCIDQEDRINSKYNFMKSERQLHKYGFNQTIHMYAKKAKRLIRK